MGSVRPLRGTLAVRPGPDPAAAGGRAAPGGGRVLRRDPAGDRADLRGGAGGPWAGPRWASPRAQRGPMAYTTIAVVAALAAGALGRWGAHTPGTPPATRGG